MNRYRVGISYGDTLVGASDSALAAALDDAVVVGAQWVRADLSWADIQWESPQQFRWALFDRVVDAAADRGLSVLPVLAYTPPWARLGGCDSPSCPPADSRLFAQYAAAAAARYGPRGVQIWEVWNEPNFAGFWAPRADPQAYNTLLKRTASALKRADPGATVVLGGLAAVRTDQDSLSQTDFLAQVSARGGNRWVDAVGYHPYTYPYLASYPAPWGSAWNRIDATPVSLRSVLRQYGTPDLPIWLTEYGAPT